MTHLALIAGTGQVPFELVSKLRTPPLVCALGSFEPLGLEVDVWFSLARLVPFLKALKERGVTHIAMVGAVNRPQINPDEFDPETAALLPEMIAAVQGGDDGALRWVITTIERFGFTVQGIPDLAPDLLAPEGVLTRRAPTDAELADGRRGAEILRALDPVDVGQACAVASGLCLGVEALYGTQGLLHDLSMHRSMREPQTGGVLIKRAKRHQDLRADLPTIGPDTITALLQAQLTGLCIQAGHVILADRERLLADADDAGVTIWAEP